MPREVPVVPGQARLPPPKTPRNFQQSQQILVSCPLSRRKTAQRHNEIKIQISGQLLHQLSLNRCAQFVSAVQASGVPTSPGINRASYPIIFARTEAFQLHSIRDVSTFDKDQAAKKPAMNLVVLCLSRRILSQM